METTYIPYSKRNNITDPDIAGLLDYLERVMGWEIELRKSPSGDSLEIVYSLNFNEVHLIAIDTAMLISGEVEYRFFDGGIYRHYLKMRSKIFFRTYKTLLPVIRDLYSNK